MKRKDTLFLRCKKADLNMFPTIIIFFIVLIVFAMGIVYIYPSFKDVNDDIQADPEFNTDMKDASNIISNRYPSFADGAFVFIMLMMLVILILLPQFDASPAFYIAGIFFFVVMILIGISMSNAYEESLQDPDLSTMDTTFPLTYFMMTHLVSILIAEFILIIISVYIKVNR